MNKKYNYIDFAINNIKKRIIIENIVILHLRDFLRIKKKYKYLPNAYRIK